MKILIDHDLPFSLAHGGLQIQIEQTARALREAGVEVEFLRWWDSGQKGDVLHFFGRPAPDYIDFAHQKGMPVVMSELLTAPGSRSARQRWAQKRFIKTAQALLPASLIRRFAWDSYQMADACIALTPWEGRLMRQLFNAPPSRLHVVPNGVEPVFFEKGGETRGEWLICTATITERKRVLELAEACLLAQVPLRVIGRPYCESDPYFQRFAALCEREPRLLRYEGPVSNRDILAKEYRQARGFVLLSTMESMSLAALEAAAAGTPLLLADLPWARSVFGKSARYCPLKKSAAETGRYLRKFYEDAPSLSPPPRPPGWSEVALQLKSIYEKIGNTHCSRPR